MSARLSLLVLAFVAASASAQELRYDIRLNTAASGRTLAVVVTGSGFRGSDGALDAHLANWGGWADLGRPYMQNVTVNGRRTTPDDSGTVQLGAGPFVLRYEVPVLDDTSADARRLTLLPRGGPGTAVAAVRNTLVVIRRGGAPVTAQATIHLIAPRAVGTFTGWAGFADGAQSAPVLPVAPNENGFYAFGVSRPVVETTSGMRIEVTSAEPGAEHVSEVVSIATRALPVLQAATGVTPDSVVRVIVRRSGRQGVSRGTVSQFGIVLDLPSDDSLLDPTRVVVVHELSHLWIGRRFSEDPLIWFMEGFNDYLALWTAAASGVITPDWFAQRLADIADEVAALPPSQAIAAAAATGRDRNGPLEQLGYRGGALAAFSFDVALRTAGKGTLGRFIGKLLVTTEFRLGERAVRATAEAMNAGAEFRAAVDGAPLGSPWSALHSVGFVVTVDEATYLAGLGLAADASGKPPHLSMGPAVVRAVDPNGAATAAGIEPGDTVAIRGARRRSRPPTHDPGLTSGSLSMYTFGSSIIASDAQTVTLDVQRNGSTRTVEVTPRFVRGGLRLSARWEPSRASRFFAVE